MLQRVLTEIENASEPLSLADLARKLEIDQATLEGMIDFWVRKGRIITNTAPRAACTISGCGGQASDTCNCTFAGTAPRTFVLVPTGTPSQSGNKRP